MLVHLIKNNGVKITIAWRDLNKMQAKLAGLGVLDLIDGIWPSSKLRVLCSLELITSISHLNDKIKKSALTFLKLNIPIPKFL